MKLSPLHLPDLGLSFFSIPKNGGTTIWNWIHYMWAGSVREDNGYQQSWLQEGPLEKETFIIRRDPVERLISGFRNFRDK